MPASNVNILNILVGLDSSRPVPIHMARAGLFFNRVWVLTRLSAKSVDRAKPRTGRATLSQACVRIALADYALTEGSRGNHAESYSHCLGRNKRQGWETAILSRILVFARISLSRVNMASSISPPIFKPRVSLDNPITYERLSRQRTSSVHGEVQ